MKSKRIFYLVLIILGAVIAGLGDNVLEKEYALSIGIVLIMFGLYKTTQLWSSSTFSEDDEDKEQR